MAKELQLFSAISDVLQQPSSLVFESMEREIIALQIPPSLAAAPPSNSELKSGGNGGNKTAVWLPISDGIITISSIKKPDEIMKNVDELITNVLYRGMGRPPRRLPVFEEISSSFDIDELMKMQIEIFQYTFSGNYNDGEE